MADPATIKREFNAIDEGIQSLLGAVTATLKVLTDESDACADDDSPDMETEAAKFGDKFVTEIKELQKLFHRQVTRLEEERTEEPPSAGLYGHEVDATTSLQATAVLKERLGRALAAAQQRAPDAMDSTAE